MDSGKARRAGCEAGSAGRPAMIWCVSERSEGVLTRVIAAGANRIYARAEQQSVMTDFCLLPHTVCCYWSRVFALPSVDTVRPSTVSTMHVWRVTLSQRPSQSAEGLQDTANWQPNCDRAAAT